MALTKRSFFDIAKDDNVLSPDAQVHHVHSMHPAEVIVPPLVIGSSMLSFYNVREAPGDITWRSKRFECFAPATFILKNVILHSSAGILVINDDVAIETLRHAEPAGQRFVEDHTRVLLQTSRSRYLSGTHISLLSGDKTNYFHSIFESAARLSALPNYLLKEAQGLLFPNDALRQPEIYKYLNLPNKFNLLSVQDGETLHIERLIYTYSVYGLSSFHPCVNEFFDLISSRVTQSHISSPTRIYIDRRLSKLRRLENEDDVVILLQSIGFVAVCLEELPLADQVRIFRNAEFIVGAHGAGFTNIGFCSQNCRILELHMDAYVNWVFRHLAALRGVRYDCVIGRASGFWLDIPSAAVHAMRWRVSLDHVKAAIHHML